MPTSSAGSASRGMTRSSERRKSATPTRSTVGVERHVDAGHQDERPLAAGDLATPLDLFLERLQTTHRAGDRVLRAAQVEVHDLQEFACALGDLGDEVGDVGVVEIDLRRADRGQPVVGPAELVARHDVVHLAAAVEHHLQQRLELVDAGHAGQRGVLADRVTAGDGALDERTLLAHLGDLGGGHGRHGDLGELRQVQHALGVLVVHAAGDQAGRVVPHHVQHREAQRVAGELVGACPTPCGRPWTGRAPPCPCPCAGCPGRGRRRRSSGAASRAVADITRSPPTFAVTSRTSAPRSIPTRSTRKSISSPGSTMPRKRAVQPTSLAGGAGLAVGGGDDVLGGGRQPHAVHDRAIPGRPAARRPGRCGSGCGRRRPPRTARMSTGAVMVTSRRRRRGVSVALSDIAPPARTGSVSSAGTGAAADREALLEHGQHGAVGVADVDGDRHDAADLGVDGRRSRCGDDQFGLAPWAAA